AMPEEAATRFVSSHPPSPPCMHVFPNSDGALLGAEQARDDSARRDAARIGVHVDPARLAALMVDARLLALEHAHVLCEGAYAAVVEGLGDDIFVRETARHRPEMMCRALGRRRDAVEHAVFERHVGALRMAAVRHRLRFDDDVRRRIEVYVLGTVDVLGEAS